MFDHLSDRLAETFKRLKGHGKLSEKNISDALREVRLALLEADVHYKVAKDFVDRVRERAVGQDVAIESGLKAGEVVVVEGADRLRDGSKVEARNQGGAPAKP